MIFIPISYHTFIGLVLKIDMFYKKVGLVRKIFNYVKLLLLGRLTGVRIEGVGKMSPGLFIGEGCRITVLN